MVTLNNLEVLSAFRNTKIPTDFLVVDKVLDGGCVTITGSIQKEDEQKKNVAYLLWDPDQEQPHIIPTKNLLFVEIESSLEQPVSIKKCAPFPNPNSLVTRVVTSTGREIFFCHRTRSLVERLVAFS